MRKKIYLTEEILHATYSTIYFYGCQPLSNGKWSVRLVQLQSSQVIPFDFIISIGDRISFPSRISPSPGWTFPERWKKEGKEVDSQLGLGNDKISITFINIAQDSIDIEYSASKG